MKWSLGVILGCPLMSLNGLKIRVRYDPRVKKTCRCLMTSGKVITDISRRTSKDRPSSLIGSRFSGRRSVMKKPCRGGGHERAWRWWEKPKGSSVPRESLRRALICCWPDPPDIYTDFPLHEHFVHNEWPRHICATKWLDITHHILRVCKLLHAPIHTTHTTLNPGSLSQWAVGRLKQRSGGV